MILALAILTGGIAVLGELARLGAINAGYARDMTQAELLCESMLAQITSGLMLPDTVSGARFAPADLIDPSDPIPWAYTIETASTDEDGLIAVAVTVYQDLPQGHHPVHYTLIRWIQDPGVEVTEQPTTEGDSEGSSSSSNVSTAGTDSGGNE